MRFRSVDELLRWCETAPPGTQLSARELASTLEELVDPDAENLPLDPPEWTWRERLWTVPAETMLGVTELAEALGRPKSYVYDRTSTAKTDNPIPHRRFSGQLVFRAGEVRSWVALEEEIEVAPPATVRRLHAGGAR